MGSENVLASAPKNLITTVFIFAFFLSTGLFFQKQIADTSVSSFDKIFILQ